MAHNMFEKIKIGRMYPRVEIQPVAGLFIYYGMGGGDYYSNSRSIIHTDATKAMLLAFEDGVDFLYQDDWMLPIEQLRVDACWQK